MTYLTKEQQELIKNIRELKDDYWFCDNPNCDDINEQLDVLFEIIRRQNLIIAKAVEQRENAYKHYLDAVGISSMVDPNIRIKSQNQSLYSIMRTGI